MSTTAGNFWDETLIVIFFLYGLAFYSMGLALLVESGRASELGFARSMRLLAGFGLLHGVHEWIDMAGLAIFRDQTLHLWLWWLRVAILVTSFLALLAFAEHLLTRERDQHKPMWRLTVGTAIWYAISCIVVRITYQLDDAAWLQSCDVLARYILGIPSGTLACLALWRQRAIFREQGMERFVRDLTIAALALALYGIVGQLFTGASAIFPSMLINSDLFFQFTRFPIQLFRAVLAAVVAISMIRVLRALEVENQQRLVCPGAIVRSTGSSVRQRSLVYGQRGAKAHPGGRLARSGGCPGMVASAALLPIRGTDLSRPSVYGCRGRA